MKESDGKICRNEKEKNKLKYKKNDDNRKLINKKNKF